MSDAKAGNGSKYTQFASVCACHNTRKMARAVTQLYDDLLAPTGLRGTQYSVLLACASEGGVSITRLADQMVMDRTTLSRNLRPLEREGLIQLASDKTDRRARLVRLTAKGRRRVEKGLPLWRSAQAHLIDQVGMTRWGALLGQFEGIVDAARKPAGG